MLRCHKQAIARIFADLIKADRIINTGEMDCWKRVRAKYSIDKTIETEAQHISFADAVNTVCASGIEGLKENLQHDCRSMAISDGFCAHSEALILIALMLMLDSGQPYGVETISLPRANFNIDIATALYIESEYDSDTNEAITYNYRSLFKEFQLAGFHFVYPPKIIEHYRTTDPQLFRQILSFLAPSLSESGIESTYESLMNMTTGVFCNDLLCNKCGITDLRNTYPSLLIKIGNDHIGETAYANYLKIEVDEDILSTVQSFIDRFCQMLSSDVYVVNSSEERDCQFHFHGFYKQLLEIFLIRKNIRSHIVISPHKEEIYFPDVDAKATGLHRRERALYALLLCYGNEGLDFSQPTSVETLTQYNKRMAKIQSRYKAIYSMFGGGRDSVPDLSRPEIRRPMFSCLRRSLNRLPALYNPEDYNVTKNRDGIFMVNIDRDMVYVTEPGKETPTPLKDSAMYRCWQDAGIG